jgi:lysophospholipase L1-like esterase
MSSDRNEEKPIAPDEVESGRVRFATVGRVGPALIVVVVGIALSYLVPALAHLRPWKPGEPVPFWNLLGRPFEREIEQEQSERIAAIESLTAEATAVEEPPPPPARAPLPASVLANEDALPRYSPHPDDAKPPVQSIELFDGTELDDFFAALAHTDARLPGRVTRIVHWGDSAIGMDGIPGAIRRRMQHRFGDAGHGFHLMAPPNSSYMHREVRFRHNGAWAHCFVIMRCRKDGHYGLGGATFSSTGGAESTFAPHPTRSSGRVSRFEVWYAAQPHGGRLRLRVDRDEPITLDTQADALEDRWHAIDVEDGPHKLEVRANGRVRVYGVTMERDGPGIVWDSLELVGSFTNRLLAYDAEHLRKQLEHRRADLVVLTFGGNDMIRKIDMSEYSLEYREVIRHVRAARPEMDCLVMAPLDHGVRKGVRIQSLPVVAKMVAAQREAARAEGCAFFDTVAAMGGEGSAGRWFHHDPRLMGGDLGHATAKGHQVIGEAVHRAILEAYVAYRGRTDPPAPGADDS